MQVRWLWELAGLEAALKAAQEAALEAAVEAALEAAPDNRVCSLKVQYSAPL